MSRSVPVGLYRTRDGDITVTVVSDAQWAGFCRALEAPELLEDERFSSHHGRYTHLESVRREMQTLIGKLTRQEADGAPGGP